MQKKKGAVQSKADEAGEDLGPSTAPSEVEGRLFAFIPPHRSVLAVASTINTHQIMSTAALSTALPTVLEYSTVTLDE